VGGVTAIGGPGSVAGAAAGGGAVQAGGGFAQTLGKAVDALNQLEQGASAAAQRLAQGSVADLSVAVIAAEKANLALALAVEVRNKAIASYQQLMQMQV